MHNGEDGVKQNMEKGPIDLQLEESKSSPDLGQRILIMELKLS